MEHLTHLQEKEIDFVFQDAHKYELLYAIADADHNGEPIKFVKLVKKLKISNMKGYRILKKFIELNMVTKDANNETYSLNYQHPRIQTILKQKPLFRQDVEYFKMGSYDFKQDEIEIYGEQAMLKELLGEYYKDIELKADIGIISDKVDGFSDFLRKYCRELDACDQFMAYASAMYAHLIVLATQYVSNKLEKEVCLSLDSRDSSNPTATLSGCGKEEFNERIKKEVKDLLERPFAFHISNGY